MLSGCSKRTKCEHSREVLTPSAIDKPASSVTLDGLLTNVSPIKNKHFVGEIVDEKTSIRVVGFDFTSQSKLDALKKTKVPIHLSNCDVQYNSYSKNLEVVVRRYTQIEASSKEVRYLGS